nr:OmpW family outer membrane protein [Caballeronia zhejiangensis]
MEPDGTAQYFFLSTQSKFRPYVGAGASYVWFSDIKLSQKWPTARSSIRRKPAPR